MLAGPQRRRLFLVARLLMAATLLGVLLQRLDLGVLSTLFTSYSATTLLSLTALALLQQVLLAERVYALLRDTVRATGAGPRALTRLRVLADWQVSSAYGAVLPSSVGGDVVRFVLTARYLPPTEAGARTLALLLVDRLVGLAALCLPPVFLALWWGRSSLGFAPLLLLGTLVTLALWQAPRVVTLAVRLVPARFAKLEGFLMGLEQGLRTVATRTRVEMFAWSLGYQACAGLFFEVAAAPWVVDAAVHEAIWVGIPTALALTVLPVSIGGLGLRESLFALVFRAGGLPAENGVALALLWGAQGLLLALSGGVLQALRREE